MAQKTAWSIRVPQDLDESADDLRQELGISKSDMGNRLFEWGLRYYEQEIQQPEKVKSEAVERWEDRRSKWAGMFLLSCVGVLATLVVWFIVFSAPVTAPELAAASALMFFIIGAVMFGLAASISHLLLAAGMVETEISENAVTEGASR